jgi:Flp pilus assembly protein TadG
MNPMTTIWLRVRLRAFELPGDRSGLAAVEFAMIVPLMLVLFFGLNELSSGIAVNRKVTLMARTLSDLTSQNTTVTDAQLTNFFNASKAILTPYASTPVNATISELYVDPSTEEARVHI